MLKRRAEQSVVDCEQCALLFFADRRGRLRDIGHHERGIRGRLDQYETQIVRILNRLRQRLRIASRYAARVETERLDYLVDQVLGTAIQRLRIDDRTTAL